MANKLTKLKRQKNSWLDDVDFVKFQSKQRKTWNSRCGTDVGVFKQVDNDKVHKIGNSGDIRKEKGVSNLNINKNQDTFQSLRRLQIQTFKNAVIIPMLSKNNTQNSKKNGKTAASFSKGVNEETISGSSTNSGQRSEVTNGQMDGDDDDEEVRILEDKFMEAPINKNIKPENRILEKELEIRFQETLSAKLTQSSQEETSVKISGTLTNIEGSEVTGVQNEVEEEIQILQEKLVKAPINMNVKQEDSTFYKDDEIEIVQENLVKTPSTDKNIKQEKSCYQPKVIFTLVNGNTEKDHQLHVQPQFSRNEDMHSSKKAQSSVTIEHHPSGPSKSPANFHLPEGPQRDYTTLALTRCGLTITPVGSSTSKHLSKTSKAGQILPMLSNRREQSVTPVGSTGDTTVTIQDGGSTSQDNSPGNNDINGIINDGAPGPRNRSQNNLTIKIGSGDMSLTNAQIKLSDVYISGTADDVTHFVTKMKQVVQNENN